MLTQSELLRYNRNMKLTEIGLEGQERLRSSRALVLGAGGLGSPTLLYLAAAGVGTIGIIDEDVVDETNLQRQVIHRTDQVGLKKVDSAADAIRRLNPHITIKKYDKFLNAENAEEIVSYYDIVIDGCDNLTTRYVLNDACKIAGIPFVYASIYRFEAQVTVFGLDDGPCYRCLFPEQPADVPTCGDAGVLGTLPGIVGCMQATEAIKYLAGFGELLSGRMLNVDLISHEYDHVNVPRRADCPACNGALEKVGDLPTDAVCGVSLPVATEPVAVPVISTTALRKKISAGRATLIDVRDNYEFMYSHLPSSISLPMTMMKKNDANGSYLEKVLSSARGEEVIFYCKSGIRSRNVLRALKDKLDQRGIAASSLQGGVLQWQRENPDFPVL
ncbi:HesA/MoeB/ThiF family protein [Salinarimonas ramus]|uniref:Molybdopterin-synthase adenylyltransferase n=1 Tax=Salinarimonas ramus TaxID=690164 RepID=A0A917Q4A1_9HYPH|nr:HesA/MoeB/ThiF family protein [Salinarimonas ramus]GGK21224.1 molybdenum cofactor biosynthesis protein MoeB [Salinarimonas ramus]